MLSNLRFLLKSLAILTLSMSLSWTSYGQSPSPQVVAVGGGYTEMADLSMSWTVGELCISTLTKPDHVMTQGFQQTFPLSPLPVELLHFYGKVLAEGNKLDWVTTTEISSDYFTLMRSVDGISFSSIATINASGTSSKPLQYQFLDREAPSGWSYYRLDQTDTNGKTTASEIISLQRWASISANGFEFQVFPSPTVGEVTVFFNFASEENMEINIHDLWGRMLQSHVLLAGQEKMILNLNDLQDGVYFLNLCREDSGQTLSTSRIVKSSL